MFLQGESGLKKQDSHVETSSSFLGSQLGLSNLNTERHTETKQKLPPEVEKGNVEYKLKLVDPTEERLQHLITQLKWRLAEGHGECFYEIGVSDKGTLVGLDESDLQASMKTLRKMSTALQAELSIIRKKQVGGGSAGAEKTIVEVLFRKCLADDQHLLEIRVAILGAADAGKSSLLGVLCYEELDNGRGLARLNLLRHRHEIESGRSSAIAREIIGFTAQGKAVNYASSNVSSWEQIASQAAKVVTFMDTCGHAKYQKTTIGGLTADSPDFACIIVSATHGHLPDVSKEQITLTKLLNIPLMICISKIDCASAGQLTKTLESLLSFLKSPGISKLPVVIQSEDDLATAIPLFVKGQIIPLFLMSSVTGDNFDLLKKLFNLLPKPILSALDDDDESDGQLQIQDVYKVDGQTIVGGIMTQGQFHLSSSKLSQVLCWLGPDQGRFIPVLLTSIHRQRCSVRHLQAGQAGTVGIKFLSKQQMELWEQQGDTSQNKSLSSLDSSIHGWTDCVPDFFKVRRGKVLAAFSDVKPEITNEIRVDLLLVTGNFQIGQDLTLHVGSVICSAKIIDIGDSITSKALVESPATSPLLEPLSFDALNNNLPSPTSPSRKKRRRIYSGITLKQGESAIVTFKLMSEAEVIGKRSSVVARGPDVKSVGKIVSQRFNPQ